MLRRLRSVPRDLGLQLFVLYLLLIVPFLASLAFFDQFVGQRIRTDVEANDLALVRAISQETDRSVRNALEAVRGLSRYDAVSRSDSAGMQGLFSLLLATRPDVNLVYRLNSNGIMVYHYPVGPGSTVGTDFSFRAYFRNALGTREPLISEGRISPTTDQAVATAVMPLWSPQGDFLGVVATNIRLESLSETLSAITSSHQREEGFQVAIVDSDGQVIAYPEDSMLLHPLSELVPDAAGIPGTDEPKFLIAKDRQDEERLYTYASIPSAGWSVIASRPTAEAFGTQLTLRRISLVVAVSFILIGLVFWVALARRVLRPIEQLAAVSEAIGRNQQINSGQRQSLKDIEQRPDQIGHLVRSTFRMEESIRARIREQATLLETSKAVVSTLDLEIVLDRILEQVERLLDVKMSAIVAHEAATGLFKIRASHGLSKRFADQLTIQPYEPSSVTVRALHSREPIQVSDTETDPSYTPRRPRARAEGFRSVLAVPLNTKHAPPAALVIYMPVPHVFSEVEIELLLSFANQATMAIENATLFERSDARLQEQTRRLEALVQSLSDGLILSRPEGTVIYANRRVAELSEVAQEDIAGMPVEKVLDRILSRSAAAEETRGQLKAAIEGFSQDRLEISLQERERTLYLRLETFDVTDPRGVSIGRGLFFHDITPDYELDRMKTSLVSTVSHELRTPLAAIKGYASTLLAEDVQWDPAAQREFLNIISDESDRLSSLVDNLLDLSRIEAGSLKVSLQQSEIAHIISNAAHQARLNPPAELHMDAAPDLPPFFADPARLETVIRNLIENSVKYAGSQVCIDISVQVEGDSFVFRLHDNGPGIPAEESDRIFERFYRIDDSLARVTSGAGLGLAICRGLVHAHGGMIWLEPAQSGTCIAFSIPVFPGIEPHTQVPE
jgi:signal transduction histidine kinase